MGSAPSPACRFTGFCFSGWCQCVLVLRYYAAPLTCNSRSGRGPRESAHASGGGSVAYRPRYRYQITVRRQRLRRLAQSSSQLRGWWGGHQDKQHCLVSIAAKEALPWHGVAVRARDKRRWGRRLRAPRAFPDPRSWLQLGSIRPDQTPGSHGEPYRHPP
jgi:hypothetical protein